MTFQFSACPKLTIWHLSVAAAHSTTVNRQSRNGPFDFNSQFYQMRRRISMRGRVRPTRVIFEGEKYAYQAHLVPCIRPCLKKSHRLFIVLGCSTPQHNVTQKNQQPCKFPLRPGLWASLDWTMNSFERQNRFPRIFLGISSTSTPIIDEGK